MELSELREKWTKQSILFANRIKKRHSHLRKWAKRNQISCFRLYDQDIPELPFQLDLYEKYLHLSEIVRFKDLSEDEHLEWTELMADTAARTLGIPRSYVFTKFRKIQKQKDQYEKLGNESSTLIAHEGGLDFEVNLSDYLDTGLFLDHRIARSIIRDLSLGARVVNLFSYTGSFSVYAAAGGASSTLSVDLSNTYTSWAERNLERNGFGSNLHRCIAMNVLEFLAKAKLQRDQFDLIILDPPTFSNSKKMTGTLDIQRDHRSLLIDCAQLLSKKGMLFFSNNFKRFTMDPEIESRFLVTELTQQTIPEDFLRKRPHRSYLIQTK
ncbi:MAG: oxidoreductase [Spirochaetales bacterium]|nr:oxidoreductase [Spirochaetales bacterium]